MICLYGYVAPIQCFILISFLGFFFVGWVYDVHHFQMYVFQQFMLTKDY